MGWIWDIALGVPTLIFLCFVGTALGRVIADWIEGD